MVDRAHKWPYHDLSLPISSIWLLPRQDKQPGVSAIPDPQLGQYSPQRNERAYHERFKPRTLPPKFAHGAEQRVGTPEHRMVFPKSWNEPEEGNHMKTELRYGQGYLGVLHDELMAFDK